MTTLRWFPNSWFEIVGESTVIDVDPTVLAGRTDAMPTGLRAPDIILVTHHHPDHCDPKTVAELSSEDTIVLAPAMTAERLGAIASVVRPGDRLGVLGVDVQVVDAYNTPDGRSTQKAHIKGQCVGYVITIDGSRIYHAGDTDVIPEMSGFGPIDVALLPTGGVYTMDAEEAASAALVLAGTSAGMLAVAMHVRDADPSPFVAALEGTNVEARVLRPGEPLVL